MGLMDKFRGTMDRLTEKMDAVSEPSAAGGYAWPPDQPMAVLVESEYRPGARLNSSQDGVDLTGLAVEKLTGVPYRFVLDVRRPGMEPYRIEQRVRIPSKVQSSWTQGEVRVPKGTEVPLRVTGPGHEDVEIDWEGFLALPGRQQRTERLEAESRWDKIGADFERKTKPALVQKIRDGNRMAALAGADAVLAGRLSREQFDRDMEQALRMGHLLPADYQTALAKLDR